MEKSKKSINVEGENVRGGKIFFFKISKHDFTLFRDESKHLSLFAQMIVHFFLLDPF